MIDVTERAKKELKKILSSKVDNPLAGLRLSTSGPLGQFAFSIDVEMPGDQVVEYESSKVLLAEGELATRLKGHTLDIEDTAEGTQLVLLTP